MGVNRRRIGLIRVLTTSDEETLQSHGRILMELFPQWEVLSACIPDQPEGIHDERTKTEALPKIEELAMSMTDEDIDGLIISCADDPAVDSLNRKLSIPVVGAGRSTALLAMGLGERVGVIGITDETPKIMKKVLKGFLFEESRPAGVSTTLDLMTPEGKESVLIEAHRLKSEGVDVLALACTGMSTVSLAPEIRRETGLRVIDPVSAEGFFMWAALNF
jgi:Asp/Glu/hydantoin racemase